MYLHCDSLCLYLLDRELGCCWQAAGQDMGSQQFSAADDAEDDNSIVEQGRNFIRTLIFTIGNHINPNSQNYFSRHDENALVPLSFLTVTQLFDIMEALSRSDRQEWSECIQQEVMYLIQQGNGWFASLADAWCKSSKRSGGVSAVSDAFFRGCL